MKKKMPKHIVNLLILLTCFLLLAYAAKSYMTDPSFYRYGNYRADAVPEIAAPSPRFRGTEFCLTCHDERTSDWPVGAHRTVQCEVCHGVDLEHPDRPQTRVPENTIELCTVCHEALAARPATQPQIVTAEHPLPDEAGQQCHTCHDPHSPGDLALSAGAADAEVPATGTATTAMAPATASKCAKCHGQQGEGKRNAPAIAGLEPGAFIELMNAYLTGERDDKRMAKYAGELSAGETEELANYYRGLADDPSNEEREGTSQ